MHLGLHRQKQRRLNFDEAYNAKFALSMMEATPDTCCSCPHARTWSKQLALHCCTAIRQHFASNSIVMHNVPSIGNCDLFCSRLESTCIAVTGHGGQRTVHLRCL